MNRIVISACLLLVLSGCSNAPREVNASLPLVNKSTQALGKPIPASLWSQLEEEDLLSASSRVRYKHYTIEMSPSYISALGHTCRVLDFYQDEDQTQGVGGTKVSTRVACKAATSPTTNETHQPWFLVKDIIKDATAVKL
ncbi:hypothetical protein AB6D40_022715 [Vibrio cyclitrophicus]